MVRRKENKKFNLIKLIGLLLFACGMFMIVYNYSTKVKLDENNDTKIEEFFDDDNNLLMLTLGIIMCFIGLSGIIVFIGINLDTIKSWFII